MILLGSLGLAYLSGYVARQLRLPGGAIVGAVVVTAAISVAIGDVVVPDVLRVVLFLGVGTMIGSRVDRESIRALPGIALQAVVAGALLILAGIAIAFLLRWLDMAPDGDVLATSPGALSVLAAAALENDLDAPTVSLFHILRIVLILVTLPILVALLPRDPNAADALEVLTGTTDSPAAAGRARANLADMGWLALTLAGAGLGGLAATLMGIPGPLMFGAVAGAAVVTLAVDRVTYRPTWLPFVIQTGLGWLIGTLVTEETLVALGEAVMPALLSSILIIVAGIAIALLLRIIGIAPPGDVLATSPGAVEALATVADEQNAGPLQVAVFHTMRLVLVIGSLPLLLQLT